MPRIGIVFYVYINSYAVVSLHKNNPLPHLLLVLKSAKVLNLVSGYLFAFMDSTPPSSKRIKTRVVRRGRHIEAWFSGEDEEIEKYLHETSRTTINNPKLISFTWLKEQKLGELRSLLKKQMLKRFLEMSGNTYLDLIRVFYTNLQFVRNNLFSHVKGVDMEITHEVWIAITGLKYAGLRINKENIRVVDKFNKIQFYKNCLKNPQAKVRKFSVGGLKLNERLIALILTWMLTPRGSNHYVLTEEDLVMEIK